MKNPCSVPWFLRPLVPTEDAAWQLCCGLHDEDYRRGTFGDETGRFIADAKFLLRMLEYRVDPTWADIYYQFVRTNGNGRYGPGLGHPIEAPKPTPVPEAP